MDFSKLSREDWLVGGGGILLIIFLFVLPWYSVDGYSSAATNSPYSIWGILALLVLIVVVADWALATFSPDTTLPTTPLGRDLTRAAGAGLVLLLLLIKLIAHTGSWGIGFYIDIIVSIAVLYGAWSAAQGKSTPVSRA